MLRHALTYHLCREQNKKALFRAHSSMGASAWGEAPHTSNAKESGHARDKLICGMGEVRRLVRSVCVHVHRIAN